MHKVLVCSTSKAAKGSRPRETLTFGLESCSELGRSISFGGTAGLLEGIQLNQPSSARGEADKASKRFGVESERCVYVRSHVYAPDAQVVYQLGAHVMVGKTPHVRWM